MTIPAKMHDLAADVTLSEFLDWLATEVGTSMPDNVLVGLEPNFTAFGVKARCLDGILSGRSLYISLPMARIFTRDEFASAIAHELAHFPDLGSAFDVNTGEVDTPNSALLARAALFRERELRADTVGARVTSARAMGTALFKLRAFAPTWHEMLRQMRETLSPEERPMNLSEHWSHRFSQINGASLFEEIDCQHVGQPTDSHPSLGVRLAALNVSVPELAADALQTAPSPPAIHLIANHEALEQELSEAVYRLLLDSTVKTVPLRRIRSKPIMRRIRKS